VDIETFTRRTEHLLIQNDDRFRRRFWTQELTLDAPAMHQHAELAFTICKSSLLSEESAARAWSINSITSLVLVSGAGLFSAAIDKPFCSIPVAPGKGGSRKTERLRRLTDRLLSDEHLAQHHH
jgi:hypothetical protein